MHLKEYLNKIKPEYYMSLVLHKPVLLRTPLHKTGFPLLPLTEHPIVYVRQKPLNVHTTFEGVDLTRLKALLEASFGKTLVPKYFDAPVNQVIIDPAYRAAAIVKLLGETPYLDKIAVDPMLQGTGLAGTLMTYLKLTYPLLTWRATHDNKANDWYTCVSEGTKVTANWKIYQWGLTEGTFAQVVPVIDALPATMIKQ